VTDAINMLITASLRQNHGNLRNLEIGFESRYGRQAHYEGLTHGDRKSKNGSKNRFTKISDVLDALHVAAAYATFGRIPLSLN
jgi:hypothetical protein